MRESGVSMPVASSLANLSHRSLELWHGGAPELLHEAQAHGLEDRQQTANLRVAPGARISETLSRPATDSANQLVRTSLVMTHSHLVMPAHPPVMLRAPPVTLRTPVMLRTPPSCCA